ncbi:hypothetical protein [Kineosporia sp. A_224]|uniref:hypothetical protein n=1 Tax=Kineosporia sp. A_224 TaxID=1962180 RepID=UPI0018E964F0|nr:hypothetical protein [Kineosporia sp. A_224]
MLTHLKVNVLKATVIRDGESGESHLFSSAQRLLEVSVGIGLPNPIARLGNNAGRVLGHAPSRLDTLVQGRDSVDVHVCRDRKVDGVAQLQVADAL